MAPTVHILAASLLQTRRVFWHWARSVGGPGLIAAAILDNSVIPTPALTDALTIVLCARENTLWPYYAFMAFVGSLIGGYLTYRLARQGGRATLEKYISRAQLEKTDRRFGRWGLFGLAIAAVLPPPAPMTPFLLAAGAAEYPPERFLGALALGRGLRFTIVGFLGSTYGSVILHWLHTYAGAILAIFIGLTVAASGYTFLRWRQARRHPSRPHQTPRPA